MSNLEQVSASAAPQRGFTPGKGALVTLVMVAMLNCMGGAAVAPALPAIGQAFPESSETMVSLVITLPSLAVAISGYFVGAIADKFGKARTLIVSLAIFTLAGLSGLVLPNLELLLVGRFVMGIAIAGISTSSTALVSEYYDADMRAKIYSLQSAATGVSVLILETTGGFLALLGWRAPFWVYLIGLILAVMAALFVREYYRKSEEAAEGGEDAAVAAGRASDKAQGVRFSMRTIVAICLAAAFVSQMLSYLVPSKMPYLVTEFGGSTAVTGLFLGAFGVANIVGPLACIPLQQHMARSSVTVLCFFSLGLGCALMGFAPNVWFVLVGVLFSGFGIGCVTPLFMNWLASKTTRFNSGKYMGTFGMACNLGQFSSSLFSGIVLAAAGTHQAVFLAGMVVGVVAVVIVVANRAKIDCD